MATGTSKKGIESLIVRSLIGGVGFASGNPEDHDREYTVDLAKFPAFMVETQPETFDMRMAAAGLPEVDPLADEFDALTTQAAETGMLELEDATETPEDLAMENEATV